MNWNEAAQQLAQNKIGIIPTDTLYGIVGSALNPEVVERVRNLKHRNSDKRCIVLISDINDLNSVGIELDEDTKSKLSQYWPGPVTVVLPCLDDNFTHLHRGAHEFGVRLPNKPALLELLKTVGPIIAPSANPEGEPPALTTEQAEAYFGDQVDFYLDEGKLNNPPSKVIQINPDGTITEFR